MIRNRRATEALDERDIREAFAAGSEWQRSQRGQDVGAQIEPDEDQMIAASEQYARSKAGG